VARKTQGKISPVDTDLYSAGCDRLDLLENPESSTPETKDRQCEFVVEMLTDLESMLTDQEAIEGLTFDEFARFRRLLDFKYRLQFEIGATSGTENVGELCKTFTGDEQHIALDLCWDNIAPCIEDTVLDMIRTSLTGRARVKQRLVKKLGLDHKGIIEYARRIGLPGIDADTCTSRDVASIINSLIKDSPRRMYTLPELRPDHAEVINQRNKAFDLIELSKAGVCTGFSHVSCLKILGLCAAGVNLDESVEYLRQATQLGGYWEDFDMQMRQVAGMIQTGNLQFGQIEDLGMVIDSSYILRYLNLDLASALYNFAAQVVIRGNICDRHTMPHLSYQRFILDVLDRQYGINPQNMKIHTVHKLLGLDINDLKEDKKLVDEAYLDEEVRDRVLLINIALSHFSNNNDWDEEEKRSFVDAVYSSIAECTMRPSLYKNVDTALISREVATFKVPDRPELAVADLVRRFGGVSLLDPVHSPVVLGEIAKRALAGDGRTDQDTTLTYFQAEDWLNKLDGENPTTPLRRVIARVLSAQMRQFPDTPYAELKTATDPFTRALWERTRKIILGHGIRSVSAGLSGEDARVTDGIEPISPVDIVGLDLSEMLPHEAFEAIGRVHRGYRHHYQKLVLDNMAHSVTISRARGGRSHRARTHDAASVLDNFPKEISDQLLNEILASEDFDKSNVSDEQRKGFRRFCELAYHEMTHHGKQHYMLAFNHDPDENRLIDAVFQVNARNPVPPLSTETPFSGTGAFGSFKHFHKVAIDKLGLPDNAETKDLIDRTRRKVLYQVYVLFSSTVSTGIKIGPFSRAVMSVASLGQGRGNMWDFQTAILHNAISGSSLLPYMVNDAVAGGLNVGTDAKTRLIQKSDEGATGHQRTRNNMREGDPFLAEVDLSEAFNEAIKKVFNPEALETAYRSAQRVNSLLDVPTQTRNDLPDELKETFRVHMNRIFPGWSKSVIKDLARLLFNTKISEDIIEPERQIEETLEQYSAQLSDL